MTYYEQELKRIKNECYADEYLYRQILNAKKYIAKNFADNIPLDKIAGEACFSKYHFIRVFKAVYGVTPYQYLTRLRIDKAKNLLLQNISITDTCALVGFESTSSFSGLFKRMTGYSPSLFVQKKKEALPLLPYSYPNRIPAKRIDISSGK
jgi:AraC-like DNA-binding protein